MDIAVDTVCYVINRARELMADLDPIEDEPGQHTGDDTVDEPPEDDTSPYQENPAYDELKEFIDTLNDDEQMELIALTWIGRGTYTAEDWEEAVDVAREEHPRKAGKYLLGQPLLADELEEGLSEMDLSCDDD